MSKRKRIKLECLECGSHFDDDYKTRHESIMHNGKRVRVQHVGAPSSPFEVCKKKASEPPAPKIPYSAPQPVDGGSPKAEAVQKPPTDGKLSSSPTSPSNQPSLSPSSSPRPSSPTSNNESEDKCAWIRVAGQVAEFLKNYERVEDILKKLKNDAVPNPKLFMIDIIDCLTRIHEESGTLLNYAKKEEGKLQFETLALHVGEEVSVEHDPGRRKKTLTENERKYLNAVGPFQLKLSVFPANPNIPANKQCRMSSVWYCEYPLLEYSFNKDAAFCFACSLFPEGVGTSHSQPEWVSDGVQQWHKMKSRGANRPGKLFAHFSSESHRAAMSDLCHFINGEAHVDILLNKSIREKKILEEQEKEYHRKVVEILVDVTKTLGRQGLAFRGHDSSGKNEDGNFTQVVNLISRHCPVMEKWLNEENSRSRHVTYLSAESQNEFIDLSGSETRQVILKEVEDAEFLSIMGDTTTDSSHKDRLATNIRYVVEKNGDPVPVERLLKMDVVLTKKTGEELAEKMFTTLTSSNIPVDLSTNIDVEELKDAYEDVRSDTTDTEWLVLKYEGTKVVCSAKGTTFETFREQFGEDERAFGYIRIQIGDEMSKRQKFVLVTWVGKGVGVIKRAKMSTDKALVKNIITNFAVEIQLEMLSEFELNFFQEKLVKASGANYGTGVRDL